MTLPPFPVDDQTLDLLMRAINPDPDTAERSSVGDLCAMYSELAGSDTNAVESDHGTVRIMRDPQYHPNDIIAALVARCGGCVGRFLMSADRTPDEQVYLDAARADAARYIAVSGAVGIDLDTTAELMARDPALRTIAESAYRAGYRQRRDDEAAGLDRAKAKAAIHPVLHELNARIDGLTAGDCHCNLIAEVVLDALGALEMTR